jgi:hypothetical protein
MPGVAGKREGFPWGAFDHGAEETTYESPDNAQHHREKQADIQPAWDEKTRNQPHDQSTQHPAK